MGRNIGRLALATVVFVAVLEPAQAGAPGGPVRIPVRLGQSAGPASVVVEEGDHLWKISARHLTDSLGRSPTDSEVSPYWRDVIEENLHDLRSGDPDLIYPGEVVTLPAPDLSERR